MATNQFDELKKEYVEASLERIRQCQHDTGADISGNMWTAIKVELDTMFTAGYEKGKPADLDEVKTEQDISTEIPCPGCKGTKKNPRGTATCLCCNGVGTISKEKEKLLKKVSKDLLQRLMIIQ